MRKKRNRVVSVLLCGLLVFQSVVQGAAGQSSNAAPQSADAHSGEDRARWLADQKAWREYQRRHPTPVFSFEQLSSISADQRAAERFVESYTITQELSARWRDALTRAAQETEAENLYTDIVEVQEAYEELAAEYKRLAKEANSGGAGLLGMVASLAVNFVVSAIPGVGPVLGSAVAGGFNKAINGGSFGEVLLAMGLAAGASYAAQEVSEAIFSDAAAMTEPGAGLSRTQLNRAAAGGIAAGGTVALVGGEVERLLFTVPPGAFSPGVFPAAGSAAQASSAMGRAVPDLNQILDNALRRLSAGLAEADAAPPNSRRLDASWGVPPAGPARALSDRVWAAKPVEAVLGGDGLLITHAIQRIIERPLEAYQIRRDLTARARRSLERAAKEAEVINLSADRAEAVEAYEELVAEYERLREEIENRGGGLLGAISSVVGSVVGTLLGGPLLGAAFAGAIGAITNGGNVGEAVVAAGFSAGVAYGFSKGVPALRRALSTSPPEGEPLSLDEFIDDDLARELEEFYIDPVVVESAAEDSVSPGTGAADETSSVPVRVAADATAGGAALVPVAPSRSDEAPLTPVEQLLVEAGYDPSKTEAEQAPPLAGRRPMPRNLMGLHRQNRTVFGSRSSRPYQTREQTATGRIPTPRELEAMLKGNHWLGPAVELTEQVQKWRAQFAKAVAGSNEYLRTQEAYNRWYLDDLRTFLKSPPPLLDHGDHPGAHPGFCCSYDPDGDGVDGPD